MVATEGVQFQQSSRHQLLFNHSFIDLRQLINIGAWKARVIL